MGQPVDGLHKIIAVQCEEDTETQTASVGNIKVAGTDDLLSSRNPR